MLSESASMMCAVMVVLPEPVPPQIPMTSGCLSSFRIVRSQEGVGAKEPLPHYFLLRFFFDFRSSITAWAAARRAIGTQNGVALT